MKSSRLNIWTWQIALTVTLLCVLMPAILVFFASINRNATLVSRNLIPPLSDWTLDNYWNLLGKTDFLTWMGNTLLVSFISTAIALVVTTLSGYAFSRFRFYGRKNGLLVMILLQMFPAAMSMVAVFRLLTYFGMLNSLPGLALVYIGAGIPFNSWMIKGYVDSLPRELEEAAMIDGATPTQTFWQVILPLMGPVLTVVAVFNFIAPYSDFIFPSVLLFDESRYTLATGMQTFVSGNFSTNWTLFAAASMLGSLPILVMFLGLQRFLVQGLTQGAVKG